MAAFIRNPNSLYWVKKNPLRDFFSCWFLFRVAVTGTSVVWADQQKEGVKTSWVCAFLLRFLLCNLGRLSLKSKSCIFEWICTINLCPL